MTAVPVDPNKSDVNKDNFIIRPMPEEKQFVQELNVNTNLTQDPYSIKLTYQPSETPTSAPVNAVPRLEKNEKMYDKMINLASKSQPVGRTSISDGLVTRRSWVDAENLPAFVPESER